METSPFKANEHLWTQLWNQIEKQLKDMLPQSFMLKMLVKKSRKVIKCLTDEQTSQENSHDMF